MDMFKNLYSVPAPLKSFYEEVDAEGKVSVAELPRYDLKSWEFVDLVKERGDVEFITYCIHKACEAERWEFHDKYIEWLKSEPHSGDDKYKPSGDAEKGGVYPSFEEDLLYWEGSEPVDTSTDPESVIVKYNTDKAIDTRFSAIYSGLPISLESGVDTLIDVGAGKDGVLGIDNVKDAVSAYNAGLNEFKSIQWIMADNTVEVMTIGDLNSVIVEFNIRKQMVFTKYGEWRAGDKLKPFVVE